MNIAYDNTITAPFQIVNEFGRELKAYDDGPGPLWLLSDTTGVVGVIRASSFEDAYSIAEDEMFPEADFPTWEAIAADCDCADPEKLMDDAIFQEAYGFRPNGPSMRDVHGHGIYAKDLNGETLQLLDAALMKRLNLALKLTE